MPANSILNHIHHHRACRGKAHASGIAKQNGANNIKSSSTRDDKAAAVQRVGAKPQRLTRKLSRNSTSSWECSDSDSLNSTEAVGSVDSTDATGSMIRRIDQVLNDVVVDVTTTKGARTTPDNKKSFKSPENFGSSSTFGTPTRKLAKSRSSWADSLRSSFDSEQLKEMEDGWDDSNVIIRDPKERKWYRITAACEQDKRMASYTQSISSNGGNCKRDHHNYHQRNKSSHNNQGLKKIIKRSRAGNNNKRQLRCDAVEWEELLEMALARKIATSGKRHEGAEIYMKNLEALLVESLAPRTLKVYTASHTYFPTHRRG